MMYVLRSVDPGEMAAAVVCGPASALEDTLCLHAESGIPRLGDKAKSNVAKGACRFLSIAGFGGQTSVRVQSSIAITAKRHALPVTERAGGARAQPHLAQCRVRLSRLCRTLQQEEMETKMRRRQ
jgi:hypothetical protein